MSHCLTGRMDVRWRCLPASQTFVLIAALFIFALASTHPAAAKTPGKTYCFFGFCHRVSTIAETQTQIGRTITVAASHYDDPKRDRMNPGRLTSSGEFLRADRPDNAASPIYPDGTRLLVWNPETKQSAVVRINNAGPYWGKRTLDVSRATADKLGFEKKGVASLKVKVLSAPTQAEATYKRGRTYAPVPGPIGVFESIDTAMLSVGRSIYNIFSSPAYAVAGREPPSSAPAVADTGIQVASAAPATTAAPKRIAEKRAAPVRVAVVPKAAVPKAVAARVVTVAQRAKARAAQAVRVASLSRARAAVRDRAERVRVASRGYDSERTRAASRAFDEERVRDMRRSRLADDDEDRVPSYGGRCRAGRQARVMCVSASEGTERSRSSERGSRFASRARS
jgi:rare lipoprotein A